MGKEFEKRIDTCIWITESLCCTLELAQHCKSTILQYKIKIKKKYGTKWGYNQWKLPYEFLIKTLYIDYSVYLYIISCGRKVPH